jgi:hypothetical protein
MIVAQYSVHAIAGLKPDYGIHFPNIRSPEGWQKGNVRSCGVPVQPKGRPFRKGFQIGFTLIRVGTEATRNYIRIVLSKSALGLFRFCITLNRPYMQGLTSLKTV